jgi:hypothetical protein
LLAEQKSYESLEDLCDDILESSNIRITKMRRLAGVLRHGSVKTIGDRLKEYDVAVEIWNQKLGVFAVKLRFYAAYEMALRLEDTIQHKFVLLGADLERLTRSKLAGVSPTTRDVALLDNLLNELNGSVVSFNRDLLNMLIVQKKRTYYGKQIYLDIDNLKHFPTWELVKALFKLRIERPSIVRPPNEL